MIYQNGLKNILDGTYDLSGSTIKAILLTSGYTPNKDHDTVTDLTVGSNELSGTGYSRLTLSSKAVSVDDANDRVLFDAADLTWSLINAGDATHCVLVIDSGADATSPLLACITFTTISTNGGDLVIQWNANGILAINC